LPSAESGREGSDGKVGPARKVAKANFGGASSGLLLGDEDGVDAEEKDVACCRIKGRESERRSRVMKHELRKRKMQRATDLADAAVIVT